MLVVSGSRIRSTPGWLQTGVTLDVIRASVCRMTLQRRLRLTPPE
jgi:hypothetical protein